MKRSPLLAYSACIALARHRACSGIYGLSALLCMASQSAKRKREQRYEHCGRVIPGGNLAKHCKSQHARIAHTDKSEGLHDGKVEEPRSVSEWLEYCALDLSACEVLYRGHSRNWTDFRTYALNLRRLMISASLGRSSAMRW